MLAMAAAAAARFTDSACPCVATLQILQRFKNPRTDLWLAAKPVMEKSAAMTLAASCSVSVGIGMRRWSSQYKAMKHSCRRTSSSGYFLSRRFTSVSALFHVRRPVGALVRVAARGGCRGGGVKGSKGDGHPPPVRGRHLRRKRRAFRVLRRHRQLAVAGGVERGTRCRVATNRARKAVREEHERQPAVDRRLCRRHRRRCRRRYRRCAVAVASAARHRPVRSPVAGLTAL